jgi:hypothetical protein
MKIMTFDVTRVPNKGKCHTFENHTLKEVIDNYDAKFVDCRYLKIGEKFLMEKPQEIFIIQRTQ